MFAWGDPVAPASLPAALARSAAVGAPVVRGRSDAPVATRLGCLSLSTSFRACETALARALLALPPPFLRALGGAPIVREGRTLDPQVQVILRAARLTRAKPAYERGVDAAREELDESGMQLAPRIPDDAFASIENTTLASRPVRIYRPRSSPAAATSAAMVFFHGGGHTSGSLASHDGVCRAMSVGARCTVVAVDYRRAPEHAFPAAADDCTAVFRAVIAQSPALDVDRARVGVCGDSAGGNLAAVVALDTVDDDVRPCVQVLVYPVVDLTMSFPSVTSLGHGFMLEKATIAWYRGNYLSATSSGGVNDALTKSPRASPWFAADARLACTPPAIVVTAGFDPLRDEGNAYAAKLARLGVHVQHIECAGMFHGFWNTTGTIHAARAAFDDVNGRIARVLGTLGTAAAR